MAERASRVRDPTRPERSLSRRFLLGGAGGLAGALVLGGCGAGAPGGTASTATRTVDTAHGAVEVPAAPARVVCTDFYTTYALLDVGFTPAGTAEATVGGVLPSQQAAYDALPKVGKPTEIGYEAVAALQPDLILGTQVPGLADDLHDKLAALAPTALFAASTPGDWKARAVRAADVVGRGAEGQRLADHYTERVARLRREHANRLATTTWALLRSTPDGSVFVDGPTSWSGTVLADLGATFTAAAPADAVTQQLSLERLDQLTDADIVCYLATATGQPDPSTAEVVDDPVFQRTVAQTAVVTPLSSYYAAHYLDGEAVLDQLERLLAA